MPRENTYPRVLGAVRSAGRAGLTAGEGAKLLGVHRTTAERHLRALFFSGSVVREREMRGTRGQPPWRYFFSG